MSEYHLRIVTPDRLVYDGNAQRLVARTVDGDVCILARHIDYITPLGVGNVRVKYGDKFREAACSGGTLTVLDGDVVLIAATFEWADEIDVERAAHAKEKAESRIKNHTTDYELRIAEFKLKRAINRIRTGSNSR